MAASYHNITGELTQELIEVGLNRNVSSISLTNIHGTTDCTVNLYIERKLTGLKAGGKYYIFKDITLPIGATLIHDFTFDNSSEEFGLFIKLTKTASETPAVDVIIS